MSQPPHDHDDEPLELDDKPFYGSATESQPTHTPTRVPSTDDDALELDDDSPHLNAQVIAAAQAAADAQSKNQTPNERVNFSCPACRTPQIVRTITHQEAEEQRANAKPLRRESAANAGALLKAYFVIFVGFAGFLSSVSVGGLPMVLFFPALVVMGVVTLRAMIELDIDDKWRPVASGFGVGLAIVGVWYGIFL